MISFLVFCTVNEIIFLIYDGEGFSTLTFLLSTSIYLFLSDIGSNFEEERLKLLYVLNVIDNLQ